MPVPMVQALDRVLTTTGVRQPWHLRIYALAAIAAVAAFATAAAYLDLFVNVPLLYAWGLSGISIIGLLWASVRLMRIKVALATLSDRAQLASFNQRASSSVDTLLSCLGAYIEANIVRTAELEHRNAQRHGITGLPTREPLIEVIAEQTEGGTLGIVELCDFDRLSAFDIALADQVLNDVAGRLRRMVGDNRFLAHVDRARFAIWYGGPAAEIARNEFDAVCYALRDRIKFDDIDMLPQIKSACAFQGGQPFVPAALLARTIAALSDPQSADTHVPETYAVEKARSSFLLEQDLRQAVARNELELWFQPFIDASARRVCGAEALLRWRHPKHGLIAPNAFIPMMELTGLADEVGLWTLNAGCKEAREWSRQGLGVVKIAINLSAHQLADNTLDRAVERTLQRHELPAGLLELELTETVAAVDSDDAKQLFKKLRALGVSISIDDFGAGYSSLSYLKKLEFDKLKIDREFVTNVDLQRDSQAICQSIIALGRGLGIAVLAEGIERPEEYSWLRRHGCELFQGYYFSHPIQAPQFSDFARNRDHIVSLTDLSPAALQKRLTTSVL